MTYNFLLSDGGPLVDVLPLESNGPGAQSVPRAVLNIQFGANGYQDVLFTAPFGGSSATGLANNLTVYTANVTVDGGAPQLVSVVGQDAQTFAELVEEINNDLVGATATITFSTSPTLGKLRIFSDITGNGSAIAIVDVDLFSSLTNFNFVDVAVPGSVIPDAFVVADDVTARFVAGFTFDIITGPYVNTYAVAAAGSLYSNAQTTIPVTTSITISGFTITAVVTGVNGVWTITGLNNATELFFPGSSFTVSGNTGTGDGTYVVDSVNVPSLGVAEITVDITTPIPGGATADGLAIPEAPTEFAFVAPPSIVFVSPGVYDITWYVATDITGRFVDGSSFVVKGNSYYDYNAFVVTNTALQVVFNSPNTEITTRVSVTATPTPDSTGLLVHPSPAIPFGYLQYDLTVAATSLELVGRGSPAFNNAITWGQALQDNDIHLLEHFSSFIPPVAPLQGQLWFNQGTSSLFLFTSTIYDIFDVDPVAGIWTLDASHGNVTALLTPGVKFVIYNNTGINLAGSYASTLAFQVASSFFNGSETEVTIDTTPDSAPPFTVVESAIPVEADDLAPYGKLYLTTEFKEIALSDDLQALDVKQSVRLTTTVALPAYTASGAGFGKTLTAIANGALSVDGTAVALSDRILVKDEAVSHPDHGIYVVTDPGSGGSPFILTRSTDADGQPGSDVSAGMFMWVNEGVTNADTGWVLVTNDPIIVDITALQFTNFTVSLPGAPDTAVQFNDGGVFGGDADFTWSKTTNILAINGTIRNAAGALATPSYSFSADIDSGMFLDTGNDVTIVWSGSGTPSTVEVGNVITLTAANGDTFQVGASIVASASSFFRVNTNTIERLEITSSGEWEVGGSVGTAGFVLTSNGAGLSPTWQAGGGGVSEPANQIVYGTGASVDSDPDFTYVNTSGAFFVNSTTGTTGSVSVASPDGVGIFGASATAGVNAGAIILRGGDGGPSTAQGGGVSLLGGTGGAVSGQGGNAAVIGGSGVAAGAAGGDVTLLGGAATSGTGGNLILTAGNSSSGNAGNITLSAGDTTTGTLGGNISLLAGDAPAGGIGGDVIITAGNTPGGADGNIRLTTNAIERLEIRGDGGWEVGGSQGTSGFVLTSNGAGTPPTWQASSGGAPASAQYVVLALDGTLTAERVLTGTTGEITITDGGANGNVTLSIPSAVTFTGKTITGGLYTNPELKQYEETRSAPAISAGTLTLDIANGNHFAPITLDQNITTLTISSVPAGTNAVVITIAFTADGTLRTIAWPASFKWPGGTAPTMTSTAGKIDVITATTYDNGTSWLATATQNF